ncbi:MAG TPA: crosslink repair DNA glycosylase YcaQ family protein [Terriglobales bacterium]|nr:crosslink repair DNA glycosylase YcaQ family protein [Terriglobales bacterium]
MIDSELLQVREQKWCLDGHAVRTLDDARAFLESVGFCLMYPMRPAILVPTFIGAWVGADDKLPMRQHAYNDPRAKEATELMVRALRDKAAYEAPLIDENNAFLLAASVFPYFYSLVGERNPKLPPASGPRSPYSPLSCDAFEIIRRRGPISKSKLGEMLGGAVSNAGLDRALSELWAKLRITRVDYTVEEGSVWDELSRWAPDVVREGVGISVPEALSALVSKYLDCVVAVDEGEVESFLSNFVPRTRVKEAIHALLAARELSFVHVGSKSLLQVTPPKVAYVPKSRAERLRERSSTS